MTTPRAPRTTGSPGRPGYDLDSLLAAAVKVFNDKGYDGTSMEVLAGLARHQQVVYLPSRVEQVGTPGAGTRSRLGRTARGHHRVSGQ